MSATIEAKIRAGCDGQTVGTPDGTVICATCHQRVDLAAGQGDGHNKHSAEFLAYATERPRGWEVSRIYCEDCGEVEIEPETDGVAEAIVRVTIDYLGLTHPPCMVCEVEVLEVSHP